MQSALLLASGSRGDTEPIISLAVALLATGRYESIHLCIQPDHNNLIPDDSRIVPHFFPFSSNRMAIVIFGVLVAQSVLGLFFGEPDPIAAQVAGVRKVVSSIIAPTFSFVLEIARRTKPSLIVATALYNGAALTIAESFKIPVALVGFQPTGATTRYPYMMTDLPTSFQAAEIIVDIQKGRSIKEEEKYWETYRDGALTIIEPALDSLNSLRAELGLPGTSADEVSTIMRQPRGNRYVFFAYPPELVPHDPSWQSNVYTVGPLADSYLPPMWTPEEKCPKIVEYLSKGPRPLCVTFGSMKVPWRRASVSRQILSALREADVSDVLMLEGKSDLGAHNLWSFFNEDRELQAWAQERVFFSDESPPYSWLLPQCSGVLCHGGAGTISAALRAGVPVAIAPLLVDQFFWGRIIENIGLGAMVEPSLLEAHADSFTRGIRLIQQEEVVNNAREIGARIRGRPDAATLVAEILTSTGSSAQ